MFEGAFRDDEPQQGRCIFRNGFVYQGAMKGHWMISKDSAGLRTTNEKVLNYIEVESQHSPTSSSSPRTVMFSTEQ